ncbi:MAG TPA: MurR/RpiR family transcriptional regulator [Spirochaetia bacterium]|nr:MurR/RpiR family transcriptional regulator [Spirochaetia bacterium]
MNEANLLKIPHRCMLQIQAVYHSLKSAERKATDFIVDHHADIEDLTIVELASRAGCSEATIVRLSKRLGYAGYPELKSDFASNGERHNADSFLEYQEIKRSDDPFQVFKKVFDASVAAMHDTLNVLDERSYLKAFEALCGAETIMFCGVGDAGLVALEANQRFLRLGQRSEASVDYDIQLIMASHLRKGDVLVAVSHSGKTKNILQTVKTAAKAGATTIAITNYPVSPLTKNSDIVLLTAVFSTSPTGEVISKRITELCIIESLYINYLIRKGKPLIEKLRTSDRAVSINKS